MISITQFKGIDPDSQEPVYGVAIEVEAHTEVIDGIERLVPHEAQIMKFKTELEADSFMQMCRTAKLS